jgi:translation elongation factor EF-Ts
MVWERRNFSTQEISAKLVKELRVRTQAGYTDCKKALVETEGDILLKVRSY